MAAGLAGVLLLSVHGCGYSASPAVLPQHLKTIAIPLFENQTSEYTLSQELTDAVVARFLSDNHLRIVDEKSADCVVQGRLTQYRNAIFGISNTDLAQEYRVTIGVAVVFKDQVKNREIWRDDDLVRTANYYVQPGPGHEAKSELDGRKEAIQKIADEIFSRSVQSW